MPRTQRFIILVTLCMVACAGAFLAIFHKAQRTLERSAEEARTSHLIRFHLSPLDPFSLRAQNPGFQLIAAPASFTSGAFLNGNLYLTGASGLSFYAPDGTLRHIWRTGLDLPAFPLGRIVAGRLRGATEPQILIATQGAGLLILNPGPDPALAQLLPTDPDARDLTDLLPTASGDLFLGTRHRGLLLYNGSTLEPVPFTLNDLDPAKLQITALAADGPSVLVGTRTAGLLYLHAGTVDRIDSASGLPDDQVESLAVAEGKAYVGTPVGAAEIELASPHASRILGHGLFAHTLAVDSGVLIVGTLDQGMHRIPLASEPRLRTASIAVGPEESSARIDQILSPAQGADLYALSDGSLLRAVGSGWTPALPAPSAALADRNISALAFAPDGRLWVGFFDRGLDLLNPDLTQASHLEDDHLFCINRLALDPRTQTLVAATANGLVLFDSSGRPRQTLTRRDGLISGHINDLAFTSAGLTVATPAGLTFLPNAGGSPSSLYAFQGLVNNHVYALGLSPDTDELLAGTLGGLSLLNANANSEFVRRNFTATNSTLKYNWITAILPQPEKAWLIGTYGAGLERMSADGSFTPTELPPNAPRNLVINPNALLATPTAIYAGTLGHGLLVYLNATQRWSLVTRGLPSLNVTAFAQRDGQLFVGTENGLVRIPESALAQFVSGGLTQ